MNLPTTIPCRDCCARAAEALKRKACPDPAPRENLAELFTVPDPTERRYDPATCRDAEASSAGSQEET